MNTVKLVYLTGIMIVFSAAPSVSQRASVSDEINPAEVRLSWMAAEVSSGLSPTESLESLKAPYMLTLQDRQKFQGSFGLDVSHYDFDIGNQLPKCKTAKGYDDPQCSCTINWQTVVDNGLQYAYLKASDGISTDLSFARNWKALEQLHASKQLFRGAYHFLRPGIDADSQAQTFLLSIGATNANKPAQLPPVLDMEWATKQIVPGDPTTAACPANRQTSANGKQYCDMWYRMKPQEIAGLASRWIQLVESATHRPVIIYTNASAWWDPVMGSDGAMLLKGRAVWPSRYVTAGPNYNQKWTADGGSPKWNMPPLPKPATYPQEKYDVANFWQFSENGGVKPNAFICSGTAEFRSVDLSWLPASASDLQSLFSVGK